MKLLRVLLVDDEIMIREGFKRLFDWQAHGCEVHGPLMRMGAVYSFAVSLST